MSDDPAEAVINNARETIEAHTVSADDDGVRMMEALSVEKLDTDLYRSKDLWHPAGSRGAFGGQLVAQALHAAWNTVADGFHVHSLHNYFILPANAEIPIIYQVNRIREGRTYATRIVHGIQQGQTVIVCLCSFAKFDHSVTLEHQTPMPDNVPDPESLLPANKRIEELVNDERIPSRFRERLENHLRTVTPVEFRNTRTETVEEIIDGKTEADEHQGQWFKARGRIPTDDPAIHACTIVYASDSGILMTAVRANGLVGTRRIGMMTSLDHSVWFHAPTRADEWLYYDLHSPRSNDGRGTAFGRIYNRQGVLVATTSQEGVIRLSQAEQDERRKLHSSGSPGSPSKLTTQQQRQLSLKAASPSKL